MKSRLEVITFSCILVCMIILGLVGSSCGKPMSDVPPSDTTYKVTTDNGAIGNSGSVVVPQVGILEERADIVKTGKDTVLPNENAGNGILVPVVSVVDAHDSSPKSASPLVALLPAPSAIGQSTDPSKLPVIATLPILPAYEQAQPAVQPEIRRSLRDASSRNVASARSPYDEDSSEMMDVAEDIVFRPLFRIRQNNGQNPSYARTNVLRRQNGSNYRRYNVNGYYKIPYDYFRNNNNNRDDYGNERSSDDYYDRRRSS